eukprot:14299153-Ditylum_brightwellii.AAC.1
MAFYGMFLSKAVHWVLSNIGELDISKVLIESSCYVSGDSSSIFTKLSISMMNEDNTGEIQTTNAHPMAKNTPFCCLTIYHTLLVINYYST